MRRPAPLAVSPVVMTTVSGAAISRAPVLAGVAAAALPPRLVVRAVPWPVPVGLAAGVPVRVPAAVTVRLLGAVVARPEPLGSRAA